LSFFIKFFLIIKTSFMMNKFFYTFLALFLWLGTGANSLQAQNALAFDGTNDFVTLPDINPISSGTSGQYTVETWVKLNAYTSGLGGWIYGDETGANGGIIMQISATGYIWTYRAATGIVTSTAQVPLNTWTHIAFVQDASNLKLYVNGVFIQNLLSGANLNLETTNPPKIGALSDGTRALNGTLEGMRIWNVARTATEIANYRFTETVGNETGLAAAYSFNQGTASGTNTGLTTLTDVKGVNNGTLTNFALTGATSNWVTGLTFATGLHFDGTNDFITLPDINPISSGTAGQYTVETWVKLQSYNSATTWIYGDESAGNGGIIMQIDATGYIWTYRAAAGVVTSTAQVPLNTWTHIAFVQDASNLKLYVNGVFIQNLLSGANLNVETTTAPTIGATGGSRLLNGTLDEMRIWNKALLQSDIQSRMNCELSGSESGLVAYYKFNQGIATGTNTGLTTLTDATANANNGTLSNFALTGATSNWVTSGISTTVTPSVSIAASTSGTISPTTSVTFTATPTNGGGSPTYQWKKNGTDVGTNSTTYTNATWANNDVITCVMTSSSVCASPTTATSNAVTVSVTTTVTPSVSIAITTGSQTTCAGSSVTFTATPTNGGTPTYVWQKNGATISGAVSSTYTTTSLANGDIITCIMTSSLANATPTTATSNSVTMTVNALPSVTLSNTGANNSVGTAVLSVNTTTASDIKWYNGATLANTSALTTATGSTVAGGNGQGSAANQLYYPVGIYFDASGNIYVSDQGNHRIQKWAVGATTGTTVAGGNGAGSAANQLNSPNGIYVDAAGNMYIADASNHRIQKWAVGATTGTTVAGGNGQGSAANQLNTPYGIYVDAAGNMYIVDILNHRIQKWAVGATTGTTVAGGNGQGSAANRLNFPRAIYVDGAGNVYITDESNNRVQKWAPPAAVNTYTPTTAGSYTAVVTVNGCSATTNAITVSSTVLPVEWLSFTGYNKGAVNVLTWTTANEVNNKGFNVERLMDNGQWITLGFVNAKSKAASYDFTDNTPLSTSYYRLRQIDSDGKETLSKVVSVSRNASTKLKVYPNPVSNVLTIETNDATGSFQILNLLGQQVLSGKTTAQRIDVSALPQGSYVLKVGAEQVKFVKQ
jgi:hypothetical protein